MGHYSRAILYNDFMLCSINAADILVVVHFENLCPRPSKFIMCPALALLLLGAWRILLATSQDAM